MNYAIVLAGGKGTRMNSEIPKQFLVVGGKPLISYSLDVFEKSPFIVPIHTCCERKGWIGVGWWTWEMLIRCWSALEET